jgi:hypothetical protein
MAPILLPGPRRKPYRELKYKSSDSLVYLLLRDDGTGLSAHHRGGVNNLPSMPKCRPIAKAEAAHGVSPP